VSDGVLKKDLFGNPIEAPAETRGRPKVEWDKRTSNMVLLCFARQWTLARTAKHVRLSVPTLKRVYSSECSMRTSAIERMEMRQLERLNDAAEAGSVPAEKELSRKLEQLRMRDSHAKQAPKPKAKPLGKKEAARLAAMEPSELYDVPPAPGAVN